MRLGEGSSGGVLALRGRGEEVRIRGTGVPGLVEPGRGSTGESRCGRGSLDGVGTVGSAFSCVAGGSITTSGRGGRGGVGGFGTGRRSENMASSSIPVTKRASCKREARTETFFGVRRRSTSRVEFRCKAEEIAPRTSKAF